MAQVFRNFGMNVMGAGVSAKEGEDLSAARSEMQRRRPACRDAEPQAKTEEVHPPFAHSSTAPPRVEEVRFHSKTLQFPEITARVPSTVLIFQGGSGARYPSIPRQSTNFPVSSAGQTLEGSFSAVSKPMFTSKY